MTDATGDRWVKCEELRFRGDGACFAWRKATVDEIVEHFKKQIIMGYICTRCGGTNVACEAIVNPYTPEKERFTLILTDEERLLVEERIKAGYYSAENIEKRREEAHKAEMLKKRAEICERYDKRIRQAEAEKKIMLCVFDYGLSTDNAIYYPHLNTLSFNWNSYGKKITQEEFDDFVNKVDRSQLPEGIKFELK